VVQGKWTRELSCWNLIRGPPNYYYLPSRKVKWLHQPKELKEAGRISSPEGEGLQIFQILSLKLLQVIFFKCHRQRSLQSRNYGQERGRCRIVKSESVVSISAPTPSTLEKGETFLPLSLVVLWVKLRASILLGKSSITWATLPAFLRLTIF
jgi:hypothetical protein